MLLLEPPSWVRPCGPDFCHTMLRNPMAQVAFSRRTCEALAHRDSCALGCVSVAKRCAMSHLDILHKFLPLGLRPSSHKSCGLHQVRELLRDRCSCCLDSRLHVMFQPLDLNLPCPCRMAPSRRCPRLLTGGPHSDQFRDSLEQYCTIWPTWAQVWSNSAQSGRALANLS